MKNKLHQWGQWLAKSRGVKIVKGLFKGLWLLLSRNFGMKILSFLMAILLWNFVVSSNTSITRTKTIANINGYISGQSALNAFGLALLRDPTEELDEISVLVEVAQSEFAYVSSDNVQVTLDLSSIRSAGTQQVPLKASTNYGRVVRIIPASLTLTFEALDSRMVPVNVQVVGNSKNMWYNVTRSNPAALTVSGAASSVQSITSAQVYVDVSGMESSFTVAEKYALVDSMGNELSQAMLNRSSSSVSISVDAFPTREIPISTEKSRLISGQPAAGYVVQSVSVQPESVTVAAEAELLNSITEMHIEPVSVEGFSQSFAVRAEVSSLPDFKYISTEQVYVNVNITEETIGAWIDDVSVNFINKGENLSATWDNTTLRVYISGPRSAVEGLQESGFTATVDLAGLGAGMHELPLAFPQESYPDVIFAPESDTLEVTLADAGGMD